MPEILVRKSAGRMPVKIVKVGTPRDLPAAKGKGKVQPAAPVKSIMTPTDAHALRAGLGRSPDRETAERVAKERTDRARRADVPDAAKPTIHPRPAQNVQERTLPNGDRTGQAGAPAHHAQVWFSVHRAWVAAGRLPVTISPAEIAKELGLSVEQVRGALDALEKTGQLQRHRGPMGMPRHEPVI